MSQPLPDSSPSDLPGADAATGNAVAPARPEWILATALGSLATAALFAAGVYAPERMKLVFLFTVFLGGVSGFIWKQAAHGTGVPFRSTAFAVIVAISTGVSHFAALQIAHHRTASRLAALESTTAASMLASIELPESTADDADAKAAAAQFREGQKRAADRLRLSPTERFPLSQFLRRRIPVSWTGQWLPSPAVWYAAEWLCSVAFAVVVARYSGTTIPASQKK